MQHIPQQNKRYLYDQLNWDVKALCIIGDRGVGKSTLLCQRLLQQYQSVSKALYISADNIHVLSEGLLTIAKTYFARGGEALFIDEVHKYPNWSVEVKNILDIYKDRQVVLTGSSSLDLVKCKGDLSRRVSYRRLYGLSFREYCQFVLKQSLPVVTLQDIMSNHVNIVSELKIPAILKHFQDYLTFGFYPFFLEGQSDYLDKLNNMIEKVIYEDIGVIYDLKSATLVVLKKIIWLIATAGVFTPNIDNMAKELNVSRELVYSCLDYLNRAGIIHNLFPHATGMKLIRKPNKIVLNAPNAYYAINKTLKTNTAVGAIREAFFANQLGWLHKINTHQTADFIVDDQYVFEIGGPSKTKKQIKNCAQAYLALDGIEVGIDNSIPLFLFGLLY